MFLKDAGSARLRQWPSSVGEYAATFSPREKAFIVVASWVWAFLIR
jgi:hypothetical protein